MTGSRSVVAWGRVWGKKGGEGEITNGNENFVQLLKTFFFFGSRVLPKLIPLPDQARKSQHCSGLGEKELRTEILEGREPQE